MNKEFMLRSVVLVGAFWLGGCAHQINITPPLNNIEAEAAGKVNKKVGYFISAEDMAKEVTTPGGGGDKVKYFPYKELEPALKKTLESVFDSAVAVPSAQDKAFMAANNISYVFVPTIETNSSSDSAFTWPPTHFEVSIQAKAYKNDGSMAWQSRSVKGVGDASFSEFKHDFSLSARRASLDAMNKLRAELKATQALK